MDLSPKQKEKIEKIAEKYHLKLMLLFGSAVAGNMHKESDVDVAYLPEKNLGFNGDVMLNYELTDVFGTDKIDTVDLKKAPPLLMDGIFKNHKILFCNNITVYNQYQIYANRRFIEAAPLFKLKRTLINNYFQKHKI